MYYCDISHLGYEKALKVLTESVDDINNIKCQIDFDTDHAKSKIIRDFVGNIFDLH